MHEIAAITGHHTLAMVQEYTQSADQERLAGVAVVKLTQFTKIETAERWRCTLRAIFVMIKCEMGQAYKVAREAADSIEQMSELYSTSGQYDLLGKFYLDPEEDTGRFVTEKVQALPGVKDTYTLITFNAFSPGRP